MSEKDTAPCPWETGELGQDERYVRVCPPEVSAQVDESVGLKMISIRLNKQMIADYRAESAQRGLTGYQPLMRRVLQAWVDQQTAPTPKPEANSPIAELMAQYTAEGCDFTDEAWMAKAAKRLVQTLPDDQTRCLLFAMAEALQARQLNDVETRLNNRRQRRETRSRD